MGRKGDKLTDEARRVSSDLVPRLEALGDVSSRKMFGGFGLFHGGKMFGIVDSKARVCFKVDDSNYERYEEAGSAKHGKMPYFEVPDRVLAHDTQVREWAQVSIEIAHR